jgi:FAD:protein FMN transferase
VRRGSAIGGVALLAVCACDHAEVRVPVTVARDAMVKTSTTPETFHRSYFAMGTQITLTAYALDESRAVDAFDAAFKEAKRLEKLLTVWDPESDISRINENAGKLPVVVSAETIDVLTRAKALSEITLGKFDVTFGVLSGLWKFDHDQDDSIPPAVDLRRKLRLIDYKQIAIDPSRSAVFLKKAGMKIHLGGIGKGFAVDRMVTVLRDRGFADFMVQAGGDLFVSGRHGNRAWRVGIRDPRGPSDKYFAATEVTDSTFSTSGDYERAFLKNGRRYHHILDPATGEPATRSRSVTILAPDATTAEGLSKGVFILGPEKGFEILEKVPGTAAVVVDAKNKVHVSKRLEGKLKILSAPTDGP